MYSKQVHNARGVNRPEEIQPTGDRTDQSAAAGRFNKQNVAIADSGSIDCGTKPLNSEEILLWKSDREAIESSDPDKQLKDAKEEAREAGLLQADKQLEDAAKTARKAGLLQLLRSAVKAIIDFFTRDLDLSGPSPENLRKLAASKFMDNLPDTEEQIGHAIKRFENPKNTSTFKIIKQEARSLNLPDRATVTAIANPENVRYITEGCSEKMKEDFQTAANLLKQVYNAEIKIANMEKGKSLGQLIEDVQKPTAKLEDNLSRKDNRVLRGWMATALQCIGQCSRVMIDASDNQRPDDPNLLARTKHDVEQFTTTPADKLPSNMTVLR